MQEFEETWAVESHQTLRQSLILLLCLSCYQHTFCDFLTKNWTKQWYGAASVCCFFLHSPLTPALTWKPALKARSHHALLGLRAALHVADPPAERTNRMDAVDGASLGLGL